VEDWIFEENLRPFFRFAAEQASYDFDELDWAAVAEGARATDAEADSWFEYPLLGSRPLTVGVARDADTAVVRIRLAGDPDLDRSLGAAVSLMQTYSLPTRTTRSQG
jgi:hypothetical protein